MTTPMDNRLEAALTELRAQQQKIKEFDTVRKEQRTTVLSKNRMVSVTVDSSGKLVDLSFKGNRYRNLAPAELASMIKETISRAQYEAHEQVQAAAGLMPAHAPGFDGLFGKGLDIDAMFDQAVRLAKQPIFADEETYIRAWRNADMLTTKHGSVRGWLFRVAHNIVVDGYRSASVRPTVADLEAVPLVQRSDYVDEILSEMTVQQILEDLPAPQRSVTTLVFIHGFTVAEAARVLGVPLGTAKSRVFYALRRLRTVDRDELVG
jgi:RNA polymerase sigma-70 factor (ECF subfamily)